MSIFANQTKGCPRSPDQTIRTAQELQDYSRVPARVEPDSVATIPTDSKSNSVRSVPNAN